MTRGLLLAAAGILLLAGCASPAPVAAPTPTASATESATPTATPTPEVVEPVASPFAAQDPALFATAYEGLDGIAFQSPSGNISCGISTEGTAGEFGCSILEYNWEDPPPTGDLVSCAEMIHYGGGWYFHPDGSNTVLCRGGAMGWEFIPTPALAYGTSVTYDGVTCESLDTGLTCRFDASGHGITLSRAAYLLF